MKTSNNHLIGKPCMTNLQHNISAVLESDVKQLSPVEGGDPVSSPHRRQASGSPSRGICSPCSQATLVSGQEVSVRSDLGPWFIQVHVFSCIKELFVFVAYSISS